jgi:hypothetical protein
VATKADFTEEEWKMMQKGVTGAGALVSISDPDFTDSFGEASAIGKYLYQQHVIGVAEHAASAKTGIKPSETDAIAKIKEALGATQ